MIVITAPTGNIGSQVLARLLDSGERLRVIARSPAKLPPDVRARIEVVEGSHADADVVMRAFEGADAVFWLVAADPRAETAEAAYVEFAKPACAALKARGVARVVGVSAVGRGWPEPAGHVTATLKMDDAIAAAGVAYRALACASLMENMLRQASLIREKGAFYWPTPADRKTRHVATRDVADVAARLLLDTAWAGVDSIPLIGPEDMSFAEMMADVSEVLGKPVQYGEMSAEDLRAMMLDRGASEGMADAMVEMMMAKNAGIDDSVPRTLLATTPTPTTFRQWCRTVLKPAVLA